MYHIVYLSSALADMDDAALKSLLLHSRRRNEERNVTGLLLFSAGNILQVLEGKQETVQALFDTIAQDCRHTHLYKLADGPVARRAFPEWSMGFATASPADFAQLAGYQDPASPDFLAARPQRMDQPFFELLKEFATTPETPV
ncbi:BLUF domain-containing protein [Hymenobacter sediminicola]|uniref:BLUF domain-containing protein n=1 Tax=Hymenobacter sediminicola TaxID=2761579 RepID=A0A7G7W3U9_9BACT|nr:BLUF domain-containing protein [Hymenobacter sediminicola]QNH61042.1 BLUF domain-containing protein [Hymenobacter sediminicola]